MTLRSRSDPAASDAPESREENLTTVGSGYTYPEEVLALSGTNAVVLIVAAVIPKWAQTGLLEERGNSIHALWSSALDKMPFLQGCRMGWDSVFFVAGTTDLMAIQEQFRYVLLSLRQPDLESRCILSLAKGALQEKAMLCGEMAHDLTAEGVGFHSRFAHKLKDGADWRD